MKVKIGDVNPKAKDHLPEVKPDASGVGVNYAEAYLKPFKARLEDGSKVLCKRRGLELKLRIGDREGRSLLRRLEHGPDVENILRRALEEAARGAGAAFVEEDGALFLDL